MQHPIVQVHQGKLRGISEKNVNGKSFFAFRGIPYAKPPIGDLRFRDCLPPNPWPGVRNATEFGDRCAQQDWFVRNFVGSDDCLNLNVYTPCLNPPMKKAVMVWIHGGSFVYGSNRDDLYGPDYLMEKDIVLVTINYRLGILGFLNVDDEEAPGNQGLKDQVQALKWVQQNIAQFGGDPNNVTICGDSAGGASVHYLTISPVTQGLFHKAIMHSGVAVNPWASSARPPMESVKRLAAVLNRDMSDIKKFVSYLRKLNTNRLLEAVVNMGTLKDEILVIHPFLPSVDSKAKNPFLTLPPEDAIKAGIKVPCICGYVSHEGIIVVGALTNQMYKTIEADPDTALIHPTVLRFLAKHNVSVDDVKRIYFNDEKISSGNVGKLVKLLTHNHVVFGLHDIIRIQPRDPKIPMYIFKFELEVEMSLIKKMLGVTSIKGTCHGEELNFLFHQKIARFVGKKKPERGSTEHLLIRRFTELWTNFAKHGNPTPQITEEVPVQWEPLDSSDEYKFLHITEKLSMSTDRNIIQQLAQNIKSKQVGVKTGHRIGNLLIVSTPD